MPLPSDKFVDIFMKSAEVLQSITYLVYMDPPITLAKSYYRGFLLYCDQRTERLLLRVWIGMGCCKRLDRLSGVSCLMYCHYLGCWCRLEINWLPVCG